MRAICLLRSAGRRSDTRQSAPESAATCSSRLFSLISPFSFSTKHKIIYKCTKARREDASLRFVARAILSRETRRTSWRKLDIQRRKARSSGSRASLLRNPLARQMFARRRRRRRRRFWARQQRLKGDSKATRDSLQHCSNIGTLSARARRANCSA